jgi:hypothetical protein
VIKVLHFHRENLVRSERGFSNSFDGVSNPDFEEIFEELERWNDVLKDHKTTILRGPRP